jgi:ribosome-binding factor A
MSSFRQERINSVLKNEINKIFLKELDISPNILITITRINTSSNLIQSKVYISIIPKERSKEILKILQQEIYKIQQKINKQLRIRPVPKIIFIEETETEKAGKVEEILEKLKNKT